MAGYGVIEVRRASDPRALGDVGPFDKLAGDPAPPSITVPPGAGGWSATSSTLSR